MMKGVLWVAAALLAGNLAAVPAFAFSEEPAPVNPDGTARFSDPDNFADNLSDSESGAQNSSHYFRMFGSGDNGVGIGISGFDGGAVTMQGTLQRPYDPNDPTTQR